MFPFQKKSRFLSAPKLIPETLKESGGYLPVPHQLISCARIGLKPAHLAILLYLLDKPAVTHNGDPWKVDYKHMAAELGIGITYAPKYVTQLRERGFLDFERNEKGETKWIVKLPDFAPTAKKAAETELEPQRQNIHGEIIHGEIVAPLITKEVLTTNEKTTTVAVENAVVNEVFVQLPTEVDCTDVKQQLEKLSRAQQELTMAVWFSYVASLKAKNEPFSPIATLKGLAKKALQGTLNPVKKTAADTLLSPLEKEKLAKQKRFDFLNRNLAALKRDFLELKKDYIYVKGLGNITRDVFFDFLKNNGGVTC
jgi:DNA-binding MarR family transcriptional regulator